MKLPVPQIEWNRDYQQRINVELEREDSRNRKKGADIELSQGDGVRTERLIMTSPDGTRWSITVADDGTISATSL